MSWKIRLSALFLFLTHQLCAQTKVACIGASITYGALIDQPEKNSYPAQLQRMLGKAFQVANYGVSGTTMLNTGDYPYTKTPQYQQALADAPDIVIIDLGGNDSKLINRGKLNAFEADARKMIRAFTQLPSHPRIVLLLAIPSFVQDTTGIWDQTIVKQINPHIQQAALDNNVEVLDMHALFIDQKALMPDQIHPNKEGATIMAARIADNILQQKNVNFDSFKKLPDSKKINAFYGYAAAEFNYNNRSCIVVKPRWTAKGQPWVWRARFWGHEPQLDISLLERGYHIVYCDVAELFGNATAIKAWDDFYKLLIQAGLNRKAVLEGMSRGAVYALNWAAVNPDKVCCVYLDNPVLDLKSWPAGLGAVPVSQVEFEQFKSDYNLKDSAAVARFAGSPIDQTSQIVKGKYPILILCADADEAVPPQENTNLFAERIRAQKGHIEVLYKHGFKHHPHSFPNPSPITNFILKHSKG